MSAAAGDDLAALHRQVLVGQFGGEVVVLLHQHDGHALSVHAAVREHVDDAADVLDDVGLDALGGFVQDQQLGAIARAPINDPAVVIADEPTANPDSRLAGQFPEIVASLKARGKTLVIASHEPRIIDAAVVDRVVRMADGALQGCRSC